MRKLLGLKQLLATLLFTLACAAMHAQSIPSSEAKFPLRAALVLTPEFCTSRVAHGGVQDNPKKGLEVGQIACVEFEPALKDVFADITRVSDEQKTGNAQLVLIPKFVDAGVKMEGVTAFSNQDLDLLLQWTAKDASGRTVWLETVQGSAKHHVGNVFTARKNMRLIINDAVKDLALQSASKISSSPELRKFTP
jgi:hypothetical protein